MIRPPACRAVAGVLFAAALLAAAPARADVVHLKNGGTIACDVIEERGPDLVLRQGKGVIVVPKSDVARIEKTAPGAAPSAPAPPGPGSAATSSTTDPPDGRRPSVAALAEAGERALSERRHEDARRAFEEALAIDVTDLRAQRGLAAALLGLGQPARARSVAEQALLRAPADPDLLFLLGAALAHQERSAEAIAAWKKAESLRPDPALRARIDALERQHGVDRDYRRAEAAHFTLSYDGRATAPEIETGILAFLEERFATLALLFDYLPREPIAVVIYPEKDFREATRAEDDVAGLYDGKVRLPAGGIRRVDAGTRAVLAHELAHAFIAGKSAGGAPRSLHEGLAQWVEGRRSPSDTETRLAREYRDGKGGARAETTFDYASALSFVEYLLERHGQPAINQVLDAIGRGDDAPRAFESVTRYSLADLQSSWGEELVRRRLAGR